MNATTKTPDLTRQKLLEAAFAEIHRNGFQAASLTQILAETGLTKGALYHHFPDKKALGLAVIEEAIRPRLSEMMFQPLADTDQPIATMQAMLEAKAADTDPWVVALGCPLNNLMQEMSPLDVLFQERLGGVLGMWQKTVEGALRRGQKQGEIRAEVDYKAAALFVVSAWEGCIGVAKNLQSPKAFSICMKQLHGYVQGLMTAKAEKGRHKGG